MFMKSTARQSQSGLALILTLVCVFINSSALSNIDIGANPSAEDADEGLEEGATQVNNIVHSFRLHPTVFEKKDYLTYLKVRPFPELLIVR